MKLDASLDRVGMSLPRSGRWLLFGAVALLAGCGSNSFNGGGLGGSNSLSFGFVPVGNTITVSVKTAGVVPNKVVVSETDTTSVPPATTTSNLTSADGGITWTGVVTNVPLKPNDSVTVTATSYDGSGVQIATATVRSTAGSGGQPVSQNGLSFSATSVSNGQSVTALITGATPARVVATVTDTTSSPSQTGTANLTSTDGGITWTGLVTGVTPRSGDILSATVTSYDASSNVLATATGSSGGASPTPVGRNGLTFSTSQVTGGTSISARVVGATPARVVATLTDPSATPSSVTVNLTSSDGGVTWTGTLTGVAIAPGDTVTVTVTSFDANGVQLATGSGSGVATA